MKNAYVLVHHSGDDGNAPEGAILRDVSNKRFQELEAKGLVREATDEEVEAGYEPPFEADASEEHDDVDSERDMFGTYDAFARERELTTRAEKAEADLTEAGTKAEALGREIEQLKAQKQAPPPANKKAADPANKAG